MKSEEKKAQTFTCTLEEPSMTGVTVRNATDDEVYVPYNAMPPASALELEDAIDEGEIDIGDEFDITINDPDYIIRFK